MSAIEIPVTGAQEHIAFCPFCGYDMIEQKDKAKCESCQKVIK